jgi:hypothetical protein
LPSVLISSLLHAAMSFRRSQYMNSFIKGDEILDSSVFGWPQPRDEAAEMPLDTFQA